MNLTGIDSGTTARSSSVILVSLLSLAMLTGCGGAAPTPPTPSIPAAEPSETPVPEGGAGGGGEDVAAFVLIGGSSVSVGADDSRVLAEIPYSTDPSVAAAELADVLGVEPTMTVRPGNATCLAETTIYDWGAFNLKSPGGIGTGPGALFTVQATAHELSTGVPVEMVHSQHVGSPAADVVGLPNVFAEDLGAWTSVYYHVGGDVDFASADWAPDMETWGALALIESGVVTSIVAPIHYFYDC
jgi:hypothetical protein